MDRKLPLMGCFYVLLLVFVQILRCAESTYTRRRVETVKAHATDDFGARLDLLSRTRKGRRVIRLPSPDEEVLDDGGYFSGNFDRTEEENYQIRHGFGGFGRRHRLLSRGKYGKFNSDTYACSGIQSRSCRTSADCTGCLGLYTCNISIATCKLKGVSRITDGFFLSLKRT
ncbi:hypothetical protein JZ751_022265 [Albula glossodonta]|uniref:Uncharacterized protein n=1 Tax=Albula glossodonta TaxID=121402 RepID=A0A8T2NL30_9TELE|nr:hypothetical protein JZ751_022265 [Albula glossodonta]